MADRARSRTPRVIGGGMGVVVLAAVCAWAVFTYVRQPKLTSALRGRQVAERMGCLGCHGPGGTGGVPNPGSSDEEVPGWSGGMAMMYVKGSEEIREWILDGRPKRLVEKKEGGTQSVGGHLLGGESATPRPISGSLPLKMPVFRDILSGRNLEDLIAYYKAVAAFDSLPPNALHGYRTASRLGCFGCHGPGGRVGSRNPRSFKGYIPPWEGKDFGELVRNENELRQWILEGHIRRLDSNRFARYFTQEQLIKMSAYRDVLQAGDLDALVAYVQWLNGN